MPWFPADGMSLHSSMICLIHFICQQTSTIVTPSLGSTQSPSFNILTKRSGLSVIITKSLPRMATVTQGVQMSSSLLVDPITAVLSDSPLKNANGTSSSTSVVIFDNSAWAQRQIHKAHSKSSNLPLSLDIWILRVASGTEHLHYPGLSIVNKVKPSYDMRAKVTLSWTIAAKSVSVTMPFPSLMSIIYSLSIHRYLRYGVTGNCRCWCWQLTWCQWFLTVFI